MMRSLAAVAATGLLAACGSSSSNDTTTPPVALDCTNYCTAVNATCTATGEVQYSGLTGTCASYCSGVNAWPTGTAGAASGNTLACRITHAGLAAAEASGTTLRRTHCDHAGPSGGNQCGTWCENYCFLALKNCGAQLGTGANQMGFTDAASCATACAAFPTSGSVNVNGNTVQCRIYHAGAAGSVGALPHCAHAAVTSLNNFPPTGTGVGPCG